MIKKQTDRKKKQRDENKKQRGGETEGNKQHELMWKSKKAKERKKEMKERKNKKKQWKIGIRKTIGGGGNNNGFCWTKGQRLETLPCQQVFIFTKIGLSTECCKKR